MADQEHKIELDEETKKDLRELRAEADKYGSCTVVHFVDWSLKGDRHAFDTIKHLLDAFRRHRASQSTGST